MLDKIKAFFAWVYDWITIIAGYLVGLPALLLQLLDAFAGIDLTPVLTQFWQPDRALAIITAVAVVKSLCAWAVKQKAQADA